MNAVKLLALYFFILLTVTACSPAVPEKSLSQSQAQLVSIFETASHESKRITGYDPRFENPYLDVFLRRELKICRWNGDWISLQGSTRAMVDGLEKGLGIESFKPWSGRIAGVGLTVDGDFVIRVEIGTRYPVILVERLSLEKAREKHWKLHSQSVVDASKAFRVGETVFFDGRMSYERQRYPWRYGIVESECEIKRTPTDLKQDLEKPVVLFEFDTIVTDPDRIRRSAFLRHGYERR